MADGPGGVERARVSLRAVPDLRDVYDEVADVVRYIESLKADLKVKVDLEKMREVSDLYRDQERLTVKVDLDAIQNVSDVLEDEHTVRIDADVDTLTTDVENALDDLDGDRTVRIDFDADDTDLLNRLSGIGDEASRIARDIDNDFDNIGLGIADTIDAGMADAVERLKDRLRKLRKDLKSIAVPVSLESGKAAVEMATLLANLKALADAADVDVPVGVDADTSQITRALGGLKALDAALGDTARRARVLVAVDFDQKSLKALPDKLRKSKYAHIQATVVPDFDERAWAAAIAKIKATQKALEQGIRVPIRPQIEGNWRRLGLDSSQSWADGFHQGARMHLGDLGSAAGKRYGDMMSQEAWTSFKAGWSKWSREPLAIGSRGPGIDLGDLGDLQSVTRDLGDLQSAIKKNRDYWASFTRNVKDGLGSLKWAWRDARSGVEAEAEKSGGRAGQAFSRGVARSFGSLRRLWTNLFTQRFWMQAAAVGGIGAGGDLLTITAGLKGLAGAAAAIPAAFAGAAGAVGTLKVGFVGLGEAMEALASGDPEWIAESMRRIAPAAGEFARAINAVSDEWRAMRREVQQDLFKGLASVFTDMSRRILPDMTKGLKRVADGWNAIFKDAMGGVAEMGDRQQFSAILGNLGTGMKNASDGIRSFILAFADLAEVGARYFPSMGKGFTEQMRRFEQWIAQAKKTGQIDQWFKTLGQTLRDLGSILKSTARIFGALTKAAEAAGAATLTQFAAGLERVATAMEQSRFQTALTAMFKGVSDGIHGLFAAASPAIGDFFERLAYTIGEIARIAGPVMGKGLKALLTVLTHAMPGLVEAVRQAAPGLSRLFDALGQMSPELGKAIGDALIGIGAAIGGIAEALAATTQAGGPNPIIEIIKLIGRFAEAVGKIHRAIAPVLPVLGTFFNYLWKFTVGGILESIVGIVEGIANVFEGLKKILTLQDVMGGFGQIIGGLFKAIGSGILLALNFIGLGMVSRILGPLKNILPMGVRIGLKFAEGVSNAIMRGLGRISPRLAAWLDNVSQTLSNGMTRITKVVGAAVGKVFNVVVGFLGRIGGTLGGWISQIVVRVGGFLGRLGLMAKAALAGILAALLNFVNTATAHAATVGNNVQQKIGSGFKRARDAAVQWLKDLLANMVRIGAQMIAQAVRIGRTIAVTLQAWFKRARDWVVQMLRSIWSNIVAWGRAWLRAAIAAASAVARNIFAWFKRARDWVVQMLRSIWSNIVAWGRAWVKAIAKAGTDIANSLRFWFNRGKDFVVGALKAISAAITRIGGEWVGRIQGAVKGVADALRLGFQSATDGALGVLADFGQKAAEMVRSIASGLWSGLTGMFGGGSSSALEDENRRQWNRLKNFWRVNSPSKRMMSLGASIAEGWDKGIDKNLNGSTLMGAMGAMLAGIKGFWGIHSPSRTMADVGENVALGFSKGFNDTTPYLMGQLRTFVRTYKRAAMDEVSKQFRDLGRYVGTNFREAFVGSLDDVTGAMTDLIERLGGMSDAIWERTTAKAEAYGERIEAVNEKIAEQGERIKEAQAKDKKAAQTNAKQIELERERLANLREALRLARQQASAAKKGVLKDNTDAIKREQTSRQNILDSIAKEQRELARLRLLRGKTAKEQVGYNQRIRALEESIASKRRRVAASEERIARLQAENGKRRAESAAARQQRIDRANLAIKQQLLAIAQQEEKIRGLQGRGSQSATAKEKRRLADLVKDRKKLEAERKKLIEEGRKQEAAMEWAKQYVEALQVVAAGVAEQRDKIREQLEAAEEDLKARLEEIKSYIEGVRDAIMGSVNITEGFDAEFLGKGIGQNFMDGLNAALATASPNSGVADLAKSFQARMANAMNGVGGESVESVMDAFKDRLADLGPQLGEAEARLIDRLRGMVINATDKTLAPGMAQVIERARVQMEKVKDFSSTVKRLISMGLNKTSLDQIIQAGPFSDLAAVWKDANAAQIAELNSIMATIDGHARDIGTDGAEAMFGAGRDAAAALVEGLKAQERALTDQLQRIADAIEKAIGVAAKVSVPDLVGRTDYRPPSAPTPGRNADGTYAPILARPIVNVVAQIGEEQLDTRIVNVTYNAMTGAVGAAATRNGF